MNQSDVAARRGVQIRFLDACIFPDPWARLKTRDPHRYIL